MKMTVIAYRANNCSYNSFAVVPTSFYSDLTQWLRFSECVEIAWTTHNIDDKFDAPKEWPSYETCLDDMKTSALSEGRLGPVLLSV